MTKDATNGGSNGVTRDNIPAVREQKTIVLPKQEDRDAMVRTIMTEVYKALRAKGYDPVNQIVGYILSGDPGYITNYLSARSLIVKIERDELLGVLLGSYLRDL